MLWRAARLAKEQTQRRPLAARRAADADAVVSGRIFLRVRRHRGRAGRGRGVRWRRPALGELNVRANPDNCQVYIDGTFVDYPPILDRPLAAGTHTVAFEWPDGSGARRTVEVDAGSPPT